MDHNIEFSIKQKDGITIYVLFVDNEFVGSFSSPYTFYIHLIMRVLPKLIGDYLF